MQIEPQIIKRLEQAEKRIATLEKRMAELEINAIKLQNKVETFIKGIKSLIDSTFLTR